MVWVEVMTVSTAPPPSARRRRMALDWPSSIM